MVVVRQLAFQGIPDDYDLRAVYWKLLLGHLSCRRSEWQEHERRQCETYAQYVAEFGAAHDALQAQAVASGRDASAASPAALIDDHPLSQNPKSKWTAFFKDAELLDQIQRDVPRTHPEAHGFNRESSSGAQHQLSLTRVLFIWGKLNGIGYVQGMNEVLFPLYYVLSQQAAAQKRPQAPDAAPQTSDAGGGSASAAAATTGDNRQAAAEEAIRARRPADLASTLSTASESDTFFCFNAVMTVLRDLYTEFLDGSNAPQSTAAAPGSTKMGDGSNSMQGVGEKGAPTGLHATLSRLMSLLHEHAPDLATHLEQLAIEPHYFALRWCTLLLAKEFSLPDIMRLWDSVFSFRELALDYVLYLCLALLLQVEEACLAADFATALELLQNLPPCDVTVVISEAEARMRASGRFSLQPPLQLSRVLHL